MARAKFFIGRSDRLLARLKSMAYAWRFVDQIDGQLFCMWPPLPKRYADENVNYSPFLIFDLVDFYGRGGSGRLQFLQSEIRFPDNAVALDGEEFADARRNGFARDAFDDTNSVFVQRGTSQYRFADEPRTYRYLADGAKRLMDELPTHPHIVAAMDNIYKQAGLEPGSYGAIHFRRGDCYDMLCNELPPGEQGEIAESRLEILIHHFVTRTAPFEFFQRNVEDMIDKGMRIVFASDTPETIRMFYKRYGRSHFVDLSPYRMRVPIQKAYLDFLILKNAAEIVGTGSNFSIFAGELGGVECRNVAGLGEYDIVERTFEAEFLADGAVPRHIATAARERLETMYDEFSTERKRIAGHEIVVS